MKVDAAHMANLVDPGGVLIRYRLTDALDEREVEAAIAFLSPAERERCARFVFDHDRRDYAVAHALLRTTLSRHDSRAPEKWTFETNSYGKPHIASAVGDPPPLSFSLSHSAGLVACAVASAVDVGLDVACLDRGVDLDGVGRRCFSSAEMAQLAGHPEGQRKRFFELWTLKEAFAKAIGRGLALPLSAVTFDLGADRGITVAPPDEHAAGQWHCALFSVGSRHLLALVVRDLTGLFSLDSVRVDRREGPHGHAGHLCLLKSTAACRGGLYLPKTQSARSSAPADPVI